MIRLEHLSKTYTIPGNSIAALADINLHVPVGEICGVIGQSGAGKSTLIRCVNLLERPTTGRVWLDGQELTAMNAEALRNVRRKIGMIFQHFNLLTSRNVYENIALPLRLTHTPAAEIEKRIQKLLELTGLEDKRKVFPSQLSGGQKQRVAIARALANQPQVLLCDEATSALDPSTTQSILSLLKQINRELGLTILLITHEMDVIKRLCDDVVVMSAGRIIEQANIVNLFTRPQHALTKKLVHSAFHEELPEYWTAQLQQQPSSGRYPLLRLIFAEDSAARPIVSEITRVFSTPVNILEAHMETVQSHSVGTMVLTIETDDQLQLNKIMHYFVQQQVIAEVLGYVGNAH